MNTLFGKCGQRVWGVRAVLGPAALVTLLLAGCSSKPNSDGSVSSVQSALLGPTTNTTFAIAGGAMSALTLVGGSSPYSCVVSSSTSGGATCSVSTGGVVSYTAGATAGYNIKSQRTSDFFQIVAGTNGPYINTGGVLGTTAEFFSMAASGSGFTFRAKSSNNYVRTLGTTTNNLVADTAAAASAGVYTMQDCNGTGNRFGFKSSTGTNPYWQAKSPTVDAVNNGNGSACVGSNAGAWEAFYLFPATDTLSITDSAAHSATVTVSVEKSVGFLPTSTTASQSSAITPVRAWGGSEYFSSCAVTTNTSGGGACTVSIGGLVNYTTGTGAGTDTLTVTDSQGHTGTFTVAVSAPFALSGSTSHATASSAMTSVTASGGTGPYSCSVSSTSGGTTCSVSVGGVVSYTAGATAGYNIKSHRTNDYLQLVSGSGGPYVQTGGALGSSADLFVLAASGSGFTLKANSSGNYLRNGGTVSAGNDLIADVSAAASAGIYTVQDCNGTGDAGLYNRFGFKSASGSNPYWQAKAPTVDAVSNGNGSACNPTGTSPWEGFFLSPNSDTLTITDSAGHSGTVAVTVEAPLAIWPTSATVAISSAIPSTVHAWGGSNLFTGGSSGCAVITNQSGGGACTLLGSGFFSYTAGATPGTDLLRVTDSEGHTADFTVQVASSVTSVSLTPSQPPTQVAPKSNTGFNVTGMSGTFTWALVSNNSGGSINAATGAYTAGSTGSVSDLVQVTDASGNVGYVVVNVGAPVTISPTQPAVQSAGSKTLSAAGGSGTGYTWSITTNTSGGSINASTGVYTAGATAGTDVIRVTDSVGNTSSVNVTVSCGADSSLRVLYPYSDTVFPLGLLAPLVQWSDNGTATYAKVTLTYPATGAAQFSWSEIVSENGALTTPYDKLPTALPVAGGGRAQIADLVWRTFSTAAAGKDALISVQTLEGGKGTLPTSVKVHFATEALKGTIYYQSYDTNLVTNSAPNGATLAIKVGDAAPTVVDGNTVCRDCHSVSADGSRLITQDGSSGPALYQTSNTVTLATKAESVVTGALNDGRFAWPALSPDGSMLFSNAGNSPSSMSGQWGGTVSTTASSMYSTTTGAALTTAGLPSGLLAMFPTFATDTSAVAFNYNNYDGRTLSTMSVTWNSPSASAWNFGTPKLLFIPPSPPASAAYTTGSGMAVWPSFMPAGQGGVVVQNQVRYNCSEAGADGSTSVNSSNFTHNIGAQGELWWVNTAGTPIPTRLNRANGFGYLPLGKNGHGIAGTTVPTVAADPSDTAGGTPSVAQLAALTPGACRTDLRNAIGDGDDSKLNFKPTVNPSVTGGFQWVVFTSRRMYGNSIGINPYASDPRHTDEISPSKASAAGYALQPSPKKLWVAAMNTTPSAGSDPSYPAFYLDGQELYSGNSRSFWVLPQCSPPSTTPSAANLCTTTSDCCQTTASTCTLDIPIASNPPLAHCIPTTALMCAADGGACNVDGDCCTVVTEGTRCSANKCTVPGGTGYPNSQPVTYDFQATCTADGTHPVWQLLRSQVVIPGDSTITFSAASAATQAGLSSAGVGDQGTATMTVQPPQFLTGPKTIDQVLRALVPMSSSGPWLRVTATLNPTSDHTQTPKLTSLTPTYDCLFDE